MCSFRECGRYCVRIITSEIPELTQLESVKSMIRYLPAKGTAGLARFSVRTPSRDPSPPARMTARALKRTLSGAPVRRHGVRINGRVVPARPGPGEIPPHAVLLELGPFGGLSVHLEGPVEGVPQRPGVEFVEHETGSAGVARIDDRVGQAAG